MNDSMKDNYSVVEPQQVSTEQFNTCKTSVRKLTELLGCTEIRVNQVVVEPGEVTTPHTHEGQEEVFVAITDGQIAIEDAVHDVPEGGIVRISPDLVRNLLNQTEDTTHIWLAFGAPPVGTVDDFGAYTTADEA
jgi:quercetin dioxygenase-like cupin family protein